MTRLQIKNWLIFWLLSYSSDLCISLNNFQQELFGSGEFSIQDKVSFELYSITKSSRAASCKSKQEKQ